MNALTPVTNVESYKASTDAASLCKEIVVASALAIQGRKYVRVEGWQAIAVAHGCVASSRDVKVVDGGVSAVGEVRRMSDGQIIAQAEGFVGEDEVTWFGGGRKNLPKRSDYAIRAMAQTRAISRACRSAFAHVVVMMNAGLSTTPAEEVPADDYNGETTAAKASPIKPAPARAPFDPKTGEVKPHQIQIGYVTGNDGYDQSDWVGWGRDLIAGIKTATTPAELSAWIDANQAALASCAENAPKAYKSISGAIEAQKKAMAAPKLIQPDEADAVLPAGK